MASSPVVRLVLCMLWCIVQAVTSEYVPVKGDRPLSDYVVLLSHVTMTRTGPLTSGLHKELDSGLYIESWVDVPYASPPIKNLRWKAPKPFTWNHTMDASNEFPERCMQYNQLLARIEGKEESCLKLSIYRLAEMFFEHKDYLENNKDNIKLGPVIVLIYPGTYMFDFPFNARKFTANLCCQYHVVTVVNYRLGHLGFLGTGRHTHPAGGIQANLGMLDQVMALKWVRNNIGQFAGNKDHVVFTGVGAGAAAVHLHTLSGLSRGLFSAAVMMGGSALVPWAIAEDVARKSLTFGVDQNEHCYDKRGIVEIVHCIRNQNITSLASNMLPSNVPSNDYDSPISLLGPVVDQYFLNEYPHLLMQSGSAWPVPSLFSFTDGAGIETALKYFGQDWPKDPKMFDEKWANLAKNMLLYKERMDPSLHSIFAKPRLWKHYMLTKNRTGDKTLDVFPFDSFIEMVTDRLFTTGIIEGARLQSRSNIGRPVYLYRFSYPTNNYTWGKYFIDGRYRFTHPDLSEKDKKKLYEGTPAGDDFMTYIGGQYNLVSDKEKNMQKIMTRAFVSFVHNYKPDVPPPVIVNLDEGLTLLERESTSMQDLDYYQDLHSISGPRRTLSRTVTYNHFDKDFKFRIKFSNNAGNGKFWRRAPLRYPQHGLDYSEY